MLTQRAESRRTVRAVFPYGRHIALTRCSGRARVSRWDLDLTDTICTPTFFSN